MAKKIGKKNRNLIILATFLFSALIVGAGISYEKQRSNNVRNQGSPVSSGNCTLPDSQTQESYPPQCINNEQSEPTQTKQEASTEQDNNTTTSSQIKNLGSSSPTIRNNQDTANIRSNTYPASFAAYLDQKLKTNEPDRNNCVNSYSITRVSIVNIIGGVQTVDANTGSPSNSCGGGATVVWYLMNGKWYEIGLQAQPECSELIKTTIYSEFVATCFDPNTPNQESKNPNGSITNAQ